jgi:hypothetical protein
VLLFNLVKSDEIVQKKENYMSSPLPGEGLPPYQSPFEAANATVDRLVAANPSVVVDYPPTHDRFQGVDAPGFRAAGVALTDPTARRDALEALPQAVRGGYSESQLVITGTRQESDGSAKNITVFLSPNMEDNLHSRSPDTPKTKFTILGESAEPIRRGNQDLSEDGTAITIGDKPVTISGFYLLPKVEQYSNQHQVGTLAASGLARAIKRNGPQRIRLPQTPLPR